MLLWNGADVIGNRWGRSALFRMLAVGCLAAAPLAARAGQCPDAAAESATVASVEPRVSNCGSATGGCCGWSASTRPSRPDRPRPRRDGASRAGGAGRRPGGVGARAVRRTRPMGTSPGVGRCEGARARRPGRGGDRRRPRALPGRTRRRAPAAPNSWRPRRRRVRPSLVCGPIHIMACSPSTMRAAFVERSREPSFVAEGRLAD